MERAIANARASDTTMNDAEVIQKFKETGALLEGTSCCRAGFTVPCTCNAQFVSEYEGCS